MKKYEGTKLAFILFAAVIVILIAYWFIQGDVNIF